MATRPDDILGLELLALARIQGAVEALMDRPSRGLLEDADWEAQLSTMKSHVREVAERMCERTRGRRSALRPDLAVATVAELPRRLNRRS